ncbi:MAG: DUF4190 domain-containing protein [Actinomycetota bacterium]
MAFCQNCGREISPAAVACPQCGHPGPSARTSGPVFGGGKPVEGFAIASLASAVSAFVVMPVVGSILGIVFGSMAKRRIAENPELQGEGLARAGVIVGWVGIGLVLLVAILLVVGLAVSGGTGTSVEVRPGGFRV